MQCSAAAAADPLFTLSDFNSCKHRIYKQPVRPNSEESDPPTNVVFMARLMCASAFPTGARVTHKSRNATRNVSPSAAVKRNFVRLASYPLTIVYPGSQLSTLLVDSTCASDTERLIEWTKQIACQKQIITHALRRVAAKVQSAWEVGRRASASRRPTPPQLEEL